MFLVDRLPKEHSDSTDQSLGSCCVYFFLPRIIFVDEKFVLIFTHMI